MKIKVRDGAFETNSSSTHAIAMKENDVLGLSFPLEMVRSGVITLSMPRDRDGDIIDFYGGAWFRYYRPENILLYLLVMAANNKIESGGKGVDVIPMLNKKYPEVSSLLRHVKALTGCSVSFTFDADPSETNSSLSIIMRSEDHKRGMLTNKHRLNQLLFGSESYIQTGYDDEEFPLHISTDIGPVLYDSQMYMSGEGFEHWVEITKDLDSTLTYKDDDGSVLPFGKSASFGFWHLFRNGCHSNLLLSEFECTIGKYQARIPKEHEHLDDNLKLHATNVVERLMMCVYHELRYRGDGEHFGLRLLNGMSPVIHIDDSVKISSYPYEVKETLEFRVRFLCDLQTRDAAYCYFAPKIRKKAAR